MSDDTTAKVIDINTGKAPAKEPRKSTRKRRKPEPKIETEQIFVECSKGHKDLVGRTGVLTLDYADDVVFDATFDPTDDAIPNAVIPIDGTFARSDADIRLTSVDEETWAFTIDEDQDLYENCR